MVPTVDAETSTPRSAHLRSTVSSLPWTRIAAAGALIASGGLLLSGRRKAGLLTAATGASLALLDQQQTVKDWWHDLPSYIGNVQNVLHQAQETLDDVEARRQKIAQLIESMKLEAK